MGKNATSSSNSSSNGDGNSEREGNNGNGNLKVRRRRKSEPRDGPHQQKRSSAYRGVTRHRWTGRYEAHLWDKNCWNESQNKKGRQVYLGAYEDEEAAARAYDLAALKYWGGETILNFPLSTYQGELKEMEGHSKEEYISSLRRKSSGFSRGVSKYRGVARHHHNGRWEARIGRVFGNKYLYLGTYATQEEAATAYDMAAVEYRGLNAVTNFDLSRYIKLLQPNPNNPHLDLNTNPALGLATPGNTTMHGFHQLPQGIGEISKFKEMLDKTATPQESDGREPSRCNFPEDVQTYFEWHDYGCYADDDDVIFGDLSVLTSSIFQCELDS